ncbi:MAG: hypothetical protein AUG51_04775 [Acidobacteria bacterium 13_1_20CM_3_53_8]|nr:MAG: hypothetical protein AUG51_04775 [Acidobacteria bacterium 13_1_20CM_3_53_8]
MNCLVTSIEIIIVGCLAFLFLGLTRWMGRETREGLPDEYSSPVMAIELVRTSAGIDEILGSWGSDARRKMSESTHKDFVFIFGYTLFFVALGLLLSQINFSWAKWIGWAAILFSLLAATFDFIEDTRILKAVGLAPGIADNTLALSIRHASLVKWACLFIVFILLAIILLSYERDWATLAGALFMLGGLLGLLGTILNALGFIGRAFNWLLPAGMLAFGIGAIVLAILFTFFSSKFLARFC